MPSNILISARNISTYVDQIELLDKKKLELRTSNISSSQKKLLLDEINNKLIILYKRIENDSSWIFRELNRVSGKVTTPIPISKIPFLSMPLPKPQIVLPQIKKELQQEVKQEFILTSDTFRNLSQKEKNQYIKEANINYQDLEDFVKLYNKKQKGKVKEIKKEDYTIYKPSDLGQITNKYMKKYADFLVIKYPKFFDRMFKDFQKVEMEMLSRTYISMMLFFTLLSLPGISLFFLALDFAFHLGLLKIFMISIIGMLLTFLSFYFYPSSLTGGKRKKIKLELPFALVHMSAVAGSGAQPISIFELIAESSEYPELRKEIKKILNYVNLFGYNLGTALKNVANTTPSPEFKELLNGMISTIETGGDLKEYLKEKADDALVTYKLDRNKQVEAQGAYSEVYTSILIASPLLLLVTLAIINAIGGKIGGLDVKVVAWIGVLGALPLLNIGFMFFLTASQKGI